MSRAALALVLLSACMPAPYEESPPPPRSEPRPEAAAEGATVVGRVSPEGTLVADTLRSAPPDTARVERETVVTGEIRPAEDLATGGAAGGAGAEATLATGWRVQVYASRDPDDAAVVAGRVRAATDGGAPVYVERDDPWYKVRVGDHPDRAAAERLRERLAGLGWPEAWVVRTTIRTVP